MSAHVLCNLLKRVVEFSTTRLINSIVHESSMNVAPSVKILPVLFTYH